MLFQKDHRDSRSEIGVEKPSLISSNQKEIENSVVFPFRFLIPKLNIKYAPRPKEELMSRIPAIFSPSMQNHRGVLYGQKINHFIAVDLKNFFKTNPKTLMRMISQHSEVCGVTAQYIHNAD